MGTKGHLLHRFPTAIISNTHPALRTLSLSSCTKRKDLLRPYIRLKIPDWKHQKKKTCFH